MGKFVQSQNYYEILEVPNTAPQDEVHRAYQRAKETYSNDNPALYSIFNKAEALELLKLIEEAYQVLSNQESRQRYDQVMKRNASGELPEKIRPATTTTQREDVPAGHAKTKFGVYKVDDNLEAQIQQCTEFSGELLRTAREYKNIDLHVISEHTRISKTYLTAIENENYTALPAPVFSRGFIIQYAKLLGFNDSIISKSFMEKFNSETEH